ncbi:MAG: TolC family protein [Deltaproteobacteria bacterium]
MIPTLLLCALAADAPTLGEPELPSPLTLAQAEEIFLSHGLDLLVADAQARGAEGDLRAAGAHPNPGGSVGLLYSFPLNPPAVSSSNTAPGVWGWTAGLTDNAGLEDQLSGKHALRVEAAAQALAAARLSSQDLRRTELSQLRQSFAQLLMAADNLGLAHEVQGTYTKTYDLNQIRYQKGDISEADLAKIATARLEAEQTVALAYQGLLSSKAALAFLLGVRSGVATFEAAGSLDFRRLAALEGRGPNDLVTLGIEHRPDFKAAEANRKQSEALLAQARRQRLPDIAISASYLSQFNSAYVVTPPSLQVGLSGNLPVLYQQQGEIERAESNLDAAEASEAKARAQVVSDVAQAWATYVSAREMVERMETDLLKEAKLSRDLEQLMYEKGAASLLDYLDAERTYLATNLEYHQDLANYWSSVYALEQATATPLR